MRFTLCGMLLASLLVAGCASVRPSPGTVDSGTVTPTAAPSPTALPTPILPGPVSTPCGTPPHGTSGVVAGDLIVMLGATNLNYPAVKLPDNLPLAPYQLSNFEGSNLSRDPLINPNLTGPGGFFFAVCNTSTTTTHRIESVDVRIAQFTPYTGILNSWSFCDGSYQPAGGGVGGCGGGYETYANLTAQFAPTAAAGATVTAAFTDVDADHRAATPALALSLPPRQYGLLVVHLVAPTAPGYYAFSFSLHVGGGTTPFLADNEVLLLDPQARRWDGNACLAPAMKSQIPAGSAGIYICPPSAS